MERAVASEFVNWGPKQKPIPVYQQYQLATANWDSWKSKRQIFWNNPFEIEFDLMAILALVQFACLTLIAPIKLLSWTKHQHFEIRCKPISLILAVPSPEVAGDKIQIRCQMWAGDKMQRHKECRSSGGECDTKCNATITIIGVTHLKASLMNFAY